MKIKTYWKYSAETEAARLLHTAKSIADGFFRANNFVVLPRKIQVPNVYVVYFPDLPYYKIPRFWEKVKRLDLNLLPTQYDRNFVANVAELIQSSTDPNPQFEKVRNLWDKAGDEIISKIYEMIPSAKSKIKKITIYNSFIGTGASFSLIDKTGHIRIWLRDDKGLATIAEALLTSLTRNEIFTNLEGTWQESEIIVDWLVTNSSLAKVIHKYDKTPFLPTIKGVRFKQHAKLVQESGNYYGKLGFPVNQKVFSLNGLIPEVNKNPIENLSIKERIVLKKLIENANSIVTLDDIADEVFGEEGDFSLYAISKTIERLRNKLEANGISGSYIQALRGKGYVLKN